MPGMLTKGVSSKETYYYRRVFTDAVRAFDALQHLPRVDASRAFALGTSQGGGIALAASALAGNVQGTAVRVPFLCDIPQSIANTTSYPYGELADYLSIYRDREAEVLRTMSYFDGVNFARRVQSPALFSVALRDTVCPPASIYGAYNAYAGEKALNVWRFNGHEGGGIHDDLAALGAFDKWSRRLQQNAPVNASARDSDRHAAAAVPDRALNRENTAPNRAEPMPSLPRSRRKQEEEEPL
jgi:cephalosporin-C deacetylase